MVRCYDILSLIVVLAVSILQSGLRLLQLQRDSRMLDWLHGCIRLLRTNSECSTGSHSSSERIQLWHTVVAAAAAQNLYDGGSTSSSSEYMRTHSSMRSSSSEYTVAAALLAASLEYIT